MKPLPPISELRKTRLARALGVLWSWQPLTFRGVLVVGFGTLAVRLFAIAEFDLVADVLGKSLLALCVLTVLFAFFFRLRLGSRIRVEPRFDSEQAISKRPVAAGLILEQSGIPPYFSVRVQRRFLQPGVGSPVHVVRGAAPEDGKRYLLDTILFPHRGLWELESIDFQLSDTLGLSRFTWRAPNTAGIEVRAETIPIHPLPVVASSSRAGDELSQSRERSGDLFDIKAYDPSDGVKRILWKTFAKSGQLVVRRPEPAVIPEGELALYLVAGPDDDYVAGALQDYLRQLEQNQIVVLFGTDGMHEPKADLAGGILSSREDIQRAVNRCVWSRESGTGRDFGSFLSALQASDRMLRHVVVFAPESGEWLPPMLGLASSSSVKLSVAVVPESLAPDSITGNLAGRRGNVPASRGLRAVWSRFRARPPVVSEIAKAAGAVRQAGSELILVEGQSTLIG